VAVKTLEALITAKDATKAGVDSAKKNLGGLSSAVSGLGPSIAALGPMIGLAFGTAAIKQSIDAFVRQEQAVFQLEQRLKSTGGTSGKTSEELQRLASELQAVTTYGDEAVIEMQSLLLTFTNIQGATFDEATKTVLDLSTAMGQDLKTSAVQLGKALNDPIAGLTSLSRIGVKFTEEQKKLIEQMMKTGDIAGAQKIILQELKVEFGGAAEAASKGLGGALQQMRNAVADSGESLGKILAPALIQVAGGIKEAAEAVTSLNNKFYDGIGITAQWAAALSVGDITAGEFASTLLKELVGIDRGAGARRLQQIGVERDRMGGQLALDTANMPPVPPEILQKQQYLTQQAEARAAADKAAAQTRQESIAKTIDAMKLEADTAGMSDRQATLYRLTVQGATDTQIAYADALLRTAEAQKAAYEAGNFGQAMFEEQALARRGMGGVTPNENFLTDVDFSSFNLSDTNAPNNLSATQTLMGGDDESFNRILATLGIPNEQEKQTAFDYLTGVQLEKQTLLMDMFAFEDELRQQDLALTQSAEQSKIAMRTAAMSATLGILGALQSGAMQNHRKGFEIAKVAAIAETTINTYKAATGAYAALSPIPVVGPALGIAAAAAATAAGLANVQAISSQQFGGKGGSITPPSFSSGGASSPSTTVQQPQGIGQGGGSVTIVLNGAIGEKQWFEDNVPVILQDLAARNVNIGYQPRADN
jgi:hypothetical protein